MSIGYHYNMSFNRGNLSIVNCKFTDNFAAPISSEIFTPTDVLLKEIFIGRGGALSVIVNMTSPLYFVFNDSLFINNIANNFGGGAYLFTTTTSSAQTYVIANNIFMNNRASAFSAGGLFFTYAVTSTEPTDYIVGYYHIYNCTFLNNTANAGGAMAIYTLYFGKNIMMFEDCKFYKNTALLYGGAIDITSYDFFDNLGVALPIEFSNW